MFLFHRLGLPIGILCARVRSDTVVLPRIADMVPIITEKTERYNYQIARKVQTPENGRWKGIVSLDQDLTGVRAPQGDHRAAHGIGDRVAPGSGLQGGYGPAGDETQLHQPQLLAVGSQQM